MRRLADRFGDEAASCASLAQLRILLADASRELGFDHFALLHHASLGSPRGEYVRIDNYPEGWVTELLSSGLAIDDPVHLASRNINTGFAWDEVGSIIRLTRQHKSILARSRRFGIGSGFTVPANVPGEPSASCSFAVRRSVALPLERLRCAELIGAHAFRAARRIHLPAGPSVRPHLSRRELQCLRLVALRKTDWEISRILGISAETARQSVKRARAASDTVSRTQLVVYGLRDAWISFEDAIPPQG
ncbi:MAG: LuxR family transcriptional regulator [Sphingomonas sp.]|nr:LuxR family transcriptional regulator [Sphingomonas sp.]